MGCLESDVRYGIDDCCSSWRRSASLQPTDNTAHRTPRATLPRRICLPLYNGDMSVARVCQPMETHALPSVIPRQNSPHSMMLMLKVMIMTFNDFLSRSNRFRFQRGKSGAIRLLFRQLDEHHNHRLRRERELPVPRQHILL